MTSCSVRRFSSRCTSSGEYCGIGMPAICASRSTASGKVTPSVSMRKSKMLPFLPEEKSNHACFWSLTKNEAVFSLLNGDRPFHSRPAFFNATRRPTTSETGRRAFNSSRNCGEKRMGSGALKGDRIGDPAGHHRRQWGRDLAAAPGLETKAWKASLFLLIHRPSPTRGNIIWPRPIARPSSSCTAPGMAAGAGGAWPTCWRSRATRCSRRR